MQIIGRGSFLWCVKKYCSGPFFKCCDYLRYGRRCLEVIPHKRLCLCLPVQIAFWKSSGWSAFHVQRVRKNSKIFGGRTYCCGEVSEIEHTLNISTPLPFTKKYFLKIKIKNIFRVSLCSCLLPLLVALACLPRLPVCPGRTGSPAACRKTSRTVSSFRPVSAVVTRS